MVRTCRKCGETKSIKRFQKNKECNFGHTHKCLKCHNKTTKQYAHTSHGKLARKKTQAKYRRSSRGQKTERTYFNSERGKKLKSQNAKNQYKKYPTKMKARSAVQYAIRTGQLIRPTTCQVNNHNCKGRIEAHHDDYSKPLDIEWFCFYHHRMIPCK